MRLRPIASWFAAAGAFAFLMAGTPAPAQEGPGCRPNLAGRDNLIRQVALTKDQLRLTFVGHATFLIETPQNVTAATDYNDHVRPSVVPTIATMNRAHGTHFTNRPDPGIRHVLRGWNPAGGPARHDVRAGDLRVRSVSTNIRDWGGGTDMHGNSIFVFELDDLCVAHLGHLHHTLTPEHMRELGRVDVVLFPVDGSVTLDRAGMIEVLSMLQAPLMIPMHFFSETRLAAFLDEAGGKFPVERSDFATIVVSRDTLPARPTIRVLPGRHY